MVEVKTHTLIPVSDVLRNVQEYVSPKYNVPLVDLYIGPKEYTISLGKESARHKKCFLLLEGKAGDCTMKFQSEYTNNCDLLDLFKSLVSFAATDAGEVA